MYAGFMPRCPFPVDPAALIRGCPIPDTICSTTDGNDAHPFSPGGAYRFFERGPPPGAVPSIRWFFIRYERRFSAAFSLAARTFLRTYDPETGNGFFQAIVLRIAGQVFRG